MRHRILPKPEPLSVTFPAEVAASRPSHHRHEAPPPLPEGAWWNGIARKWLVDSDEGPVALEPQPAPPVAQTHVPPAVKVHLG